jgi:hypothetical protein
MHHLKITFENKDLESKTYFSSYYFSQFALSCTLGGLEPSPRCMNFLYFST